MKRALIAAGAIILCLAVACAVYLLAFRGARNAVSHLERETVPASAAVADDVTLTMPNYYSSGMVFQRGKPIVVKGRTSSGKVPLTITVEDAKHKTSRSVVSDGNGSFQTGLDKLPAQLEPYRLTIASGNAILFDLAKVYVGNVFLAAGQSNMEANYDTYYRSGTQAKTNMGSAFTRGDLPKTISDGNVHFVVTASSTTNESVSTDLDMPLREPCERRWLTATGSDSEYLGYLPQLFASNLRKASPNVPVGIIQTAWGGTDILPHIQGGGIYEHHIKPLTGLRIAGVLWYQGEDDATAGDRAVAYLSRFTTLISQYRAVFAEKDLPFLYVQLARYSGQPYTQMIRQAQSDALTMAPVTKNLAMTVSIDTDKGTDSVIHPLGKDIIARRMALQWLAMQRKATVPESPIAVRARARDGGSKASAVVVSFEDGTSTGLNARRPLFSKSATATDYAKSTDDALGGFEVAGNDGRFVEAKATINSDGKTVTVSADGVDDIRQVRYQWSGSPSGDKPFLYNGSGLPASPFTLSVEQALPGQED